MLKKPDECTDAYRMARSGAIAAGNINGYFARRSAVELVVLDGMMLAGALVVMAPRMDDMVAVAFFLFAAPGLALIARSLLLALGSRDRVGLVALRPDHVPTDDIATRSARRCARAGLIRVAAPLPPIAMVLATAAVLP